MLKIFVDFLIEELGVSPLKLRGQIQIHQGDDQEKMEIFWSTILSIPKTQFNKTIIRPKGTRFRNHYGTFKLRTYDKDLFLKLQKLLDKELSIFK